MQSSPAVAALFVAQSVDGALLMPWMERVADHGCRARIVEGVTRVEGVHRLLVTPTGGFRGVQVVIGDGPLPELPAAEASRLVAVTTTVGAQLAGRGYAGPFGVDAFAYRTADGRRGFLPLCEVNVRSTFGFVTAALAHRLGGTRGWEAGTVVGLHFGKGAVPRRADIPLLAPGAPGEDDTSAWLDVQPPRPTSGSPAAGGTRPAPG